MSTVAHELENFDECFWLHVGLLCDCLHLRSGHGLFEHLNSTTQEFRIVDELRDRRVLHHLLHLVRIWHSSWLTRLPTLSSHHGISHFYHLRIIHHLLDHRVVHHVLHVRWHSVRIHAHWWHSVHAHSRLSSHSLLLILHTHLLSLLTLIDGWTEANILYFFNDRIINGASPWWRSSLRIWLLCRRLALRSWHWGIHSWLSSSISLHILCLFHHLWIALHHVWRHLDHFRIHHSHHVIPLLISHFLPTVPFILLSHHLRIRLHHMDHIVQTIIIHLTETLIILLEISCWWNWHTMCLWQWCSFTWLLIWCLVCERVESVCRWLFIAKHFWIRLLHFFLDLVKSVFVDIIHFNTL